MHVPFTFIALLLLIPQHTTELEIENWHMMRSLLLLKTTMFADISKLYTAQMQCSPASIFLPLVQK